MKNPGGSSTGSAVGVSAGYAPISIGTDTTGSVIMPATRAALYGLRTTVSIVPMKGVIPVSRLFDTIGPMAKTVQDVADTLDVIVDKSKTYAPAQGYVSVLPGEWSKIRVGVVDPNLWYISASLAKPNAAAQAQIVSDLIVSNLESTDLIRTEKQRKLTSK